MNNALSSSRELAYQIADQFRVFGSHIGLKDVVIVGGIGKVYYNITSLLVDLIVGDPRYRNS